MVPRKSKAGTTPSCPQMVYFHFLRSPSSLLLSLVTKIPSRNVFYGVCNRTPHPALRRGSADASGRKEWARRPDPTLIPVDLAWLPAPLWPQLHTHLPHPCKVRWTTSKVSIDPGPVRPAFLPGAVQTGSLLEAGLSRPCLITTPALPYPILLTFCFLSE